MIPRLTDETPVSFARQRHRTRNLGRPHDGAQRVCCNAEFGRFSTGRMVSFGSKARITAPQHFCPLHPNKQTRQDGLNAALCAKALNRFAIVARRGAS